MRKYVLDEAGNPRLEPDLFAWVHWVEHADRRVAFDALPNGKRVSTVFLGLDHSFEGEPLIYETMILTPDASGHDSWHLFDRYSTREAAMLGHLHAVSRAKS